MDYNNLILVEQHFCSVTILIEMQGAYDLKQELVNLIWFEVWIWNLTAYTDKNNMLKRQNSHFGLMSRGVQSQVESYQRLKIQSKEWSSTLPYPSV